MATRRRPKTGTIGFLALLAAATPAMADATRTATQATVIGIVTSHDGLACLRAGDDEVAPGTRVLVVTTSHPARSIEATTRGRDEACDGTEGAKGYGLTAGSAIPEGKASFGLTGPRARLVGRGTPATAVQDDGTRTRLSSCATGEGEWLTATPADRSKTPWRAYAPLGYDAEPTCR